MSAKPDKNVPQLPRHVAVIMDGNGRWAHYHGKPRFSGHRAGVKSARKIVEACAQRGIEVLTLFAFSSENWNRPAEEVNALMRLFVEVLQREVDALHENGIRLKFIGARQNLPTILQKRIDDAEQKTAGNSRMQLVLAVAFGGRWDIVEAVRKLAVKAKAGEIDPDDIDEAVIARHVSLAGLPEPDLLIRTGGENRVSNFLLWDFAYTEIWFTEKLWPDFDEGDLARALNFFGERERRFGRVGDMQKKAGAD
ncbi:MAG: isoprenyl transferase [Gammaproteobacteria bacterium]|nr:isoprenyl transferase [Gammaproteobacteria bacterium]MBT8443700.1 isoprenyl transferase [Gammaproteobacteria bacterium]NND35615.1 isoprenyl transferase [Gammaproteobacteria bacterium]